MTDNKTIAAQLFERFSASDIPGALALLSDDATWWLSGKPDLLPSAGTYDKARMGRLFERMLSRLERGLQMTVLSAIGEGDEVVLELESTGDLKNGRQYRQQYLIRLVVRDGKAVSVREYADTQHVFDVWFREA
jgi:ketosteroid isomerase-like protein